MNNILNPKLYDRSNDLKPEVRSAILDIVNQFISDVSSDSDVSVPVLDVILVGSNASYNYTPYSDLDIHIVSDLRRVSKSDPELAGKLMNSERIRFNNNYDISLYGINAEVYVEDMNTSTVSDGIYSVTDDYWIKVPSITNQCDNDPVSSEDIDYYKSMLDTLSTSDELQDLIDSLYIIRRNSLATEGECGYGNQLFKSLRNAGILDDLKDKLSCLTSKELSLGTAHTK